MVTSQCVTEQMRKLAAVYRDLGPEPQRGDTTPSWWRELVEVMKCAESEHQLQSAVAAIIAQPQRRFAPKPGELSAAIEAESILPQSNQLDSWLCAGCHDTGFLQGIRAAWCFCELGQAEKARDPGFVEKYNACLDELQAKISQRSKRRKRTDSMARASEILGR